MSFVLREDNERSIPPVVKEVLLNQCHWKLYDEEQAPETQPQFNLFWKTNRFYPSQISSARYPHQRVNHYPKSSEITKKDGLYRHMKRMKGVHGKLFSFVPDTYNLPNEYVKFCQFFGDERDRCAANGEPAPLFICKPADLSRGRKIFVFSDISELVYDCPSVVQRYIRNPLLIKKHKVDFRIYVLVTCFQPLRAYIFQDFLCRFSAEPYSTDVKNTFVHLTNFSVTKQANSEMLVRDGIGASCKWNGAQTRDYFQKSGVDFNVMWGRIECLVSCTLLSICHLVPPVPQCFELYGFDIMFDATFQPWLIEVNFSPALAVDNAVDVVVKHALIRDLVDTLNIVPFDETDDVDERNKAAMKSNQRVSNQTVARPQPQSTRSPSLSGCPKDDDERTAAEDPEHNQPHLPPISASKHQRQQHTSIKQLTSAPAKVEGNQKNRSNPPQSNSFKMSPATPPTSGSSSSSLISPGLVGPQGRCVSKVEKRPLPKRSQSSSTLPTGSLRTGGGSSRLLGPSANRKALPSEGSLRKTSGTSATCDIGSSVVYVDRPSGQFKWCFPYSPETESWSQKLISKSENTNQVLSAIFNDLRTKDANFGNLSKNFEAAYRKNLGLDLPSSSSS